MPSAENKSYLPKYPKQFMTKQSSSSKQYQYIFTLILFASLLLTSCSYITDTSPSEQPHTQISTIPLPFSPLLAPQGPWQERIFNKSTIYTPMKQDGKILLKASSQSSASMLYQQIKVDLTKTPFLNWQWKINHTLKNIDEKTRAGDDFPARIYIAITPRPFSFYPRALNYIWANHSPINTVWHNPYSRDAQMVALQSGDTKAGQWVTEKRNIKNDLQQFFGEDIQFIEGIAIMTDTDNTQQNATAFYRSLFFSTK